MNAALPPGSTCLPLEYKELDVYETPASRTMWGFMKSKPRPCFTPGLLSEILDFFDNQLAAEPGNVPDFLVVGSAVPGLYNLGGDLSLFRNKILAGDLQGLLDYGTACVRAVCSAHHHPTAPRMTTISMVQGDALGGGFEAALSANVLVAERGTKLGFPEILFNLFPGMGAMTFLGRKIGYAEAERMILSGRIYLAEDLHEKGVVDVLAEPGEAPAAVLDYIRRASRALNGTVAARLAREISQPVNFGELQRIVELWAESAMRLTPKDLVMMERLVKRQTGKYAES